VKTFPLPSLVSVLLSCLPFAVKAEEPTSINLLALECWDSPGDWSHAGKVSGSTSEKKWTAVEPGSGILYNGKKEKADNLVSKTSHGDVEVYAEFMIPKSSNSGIYFMDRYEVQILDSFGKADDALKYGDCGGIYERWDESKEGKDKGFEGTPPSTNASTAPGTWQKFHIVFRAPRFNAEGIKTENARFVLVKHNGVVIHQDVEVTGPTRGGKGDGEVSAAPFKIQGDHGPVAFRKFTVKNLNLD
jgi:hypothetical protein